MIKLEAKHAAVSATLAAGEMEKARPLSQIIPFRCSSLGRNASGASQNKDIVQNLENRMK